MKSGMNNLYKNLHNEHFLLKMLSQFDQCSVARDSSDIPKGKKKKREDGDMNPNLGSPDEGYLNESYKYSPKFHKDKFTHEDILSFINKVRAFPQIKIYNADEIELNSVVKVTLPEFENSKVKVWEGVLKQSQQYVTVFAVHITDFSHLRFIEMNLHMMLVFNPLFVNYYGLIIERKTDKEMQIE